MGIQPAMLETASYLISFGYFNSFEGKESKQNLGPQNLQLREAALNGTGASSCGNRFLLKPLKSTGLEGESVVLFL